MRSTPPLELSCRSLSSGLQTSLALVRKRRRFDPDAWILAKAALINRYFTNHHLSAAVIAVSGGIDSAVALGLLHRAQSLPSSPIQRILPVLLPVFQTEGATGQETATERGAAWCAHLGLDPITLDLGPAHQGITQYVEQALSCASSPWAKGQMVATLRTPVLYYITSLLLNQGLPGILVGTTNRDEGAWLGFFGKASDGMVDLQVLSDLHKSEVRSVAKKLGVLAEILAAAPTGDMYDARTDEAVFGAPYDFVELHHAWLAMPVVVRQDLQARWDAIDWACWDGFLTNITELHRHNQHKYTGRSPAIHLDILDSHVPGGWDNRVDLGVYPEPTRMHGPFVLDKDVLLSAEHPTNVVKTVAPMGGEVAQASLLTRQEAKWLLNQIPKAAWVPAGIDGYPVTNGMIGSRRASTVAKDLAEQLWARLAPLLPMCWMDPDDPGRVWRPCGINPLFRFISYEPGGVLVPHYDAPYQWGPDRISRDSLVVYLTDSPEGIGQTRFLEDPGPDPTFADWSAPAPLAPCWHTVSPQAGEAVWFPHRMLHDAQPPGSECKVVLRTDIIYTRAPCP